jgi:hypothetical protein
MAYVNKQNTISHTGFRLVTDGFTYFGKHYRFDDVYETRCLLYTYERKFVAVGSDYQYSVFLYLLMTNQDSVKLFEGSKPISGPMPENVRELESIYFHISKASWDTRCQKYTDQIKKYRFFDYGDWRFHCENRTIKNLGSDKTYKLSSIKLLKSGGYLLVRPEIESITQKALKFISGKEVGINTCTDTDIFFHLLSDHFGLRWAS